MHKVNINKTCNRKVNYCYSNIFQPGRTRRFKIFELQRILLFSATC